MEGDPNQRPRTHWVRVCWVRRRVDADSHEQRPDLVVDEFGSRLQPYPIATSCRTKESTNLHLGNNFPLIHCRPYQKDECTRLN